MLIDDLYSIFGGLLVKWEAVTRCEIGRMRCSFANSGDMDLSTRRLGFRKRWNFFAHKINKVGVKYVIIIHKFLCCRYIFDIGWSVSMSCQFTNLLRRGSAWNKESHVKLNLKAIRYLCDEITFQVFQVSLDEILIYQRIWNRKPTSRNFA